MRKVLFAGLAGILLLTGGAIAALYALTREVPGRSGEPRERSPQPPPPEVAAPEAAPGPAPGAMTFGSPPPPTQPPVPVPTGRPAPPPGSWEAVPITARSRALGRMGGLIQSKLNELQDELRGCFTAEGQARHGGGPITTSLDGGSMDDAGNLMLVLQLEGQPGGVRVVDAPLEARGPAGDELIACAQGLLRGRTFEVPGARAGSRYRLLFPVVP